MNSTYVQLKKNLEYLKLNQMDLHLDEVIDLITSSPLSFTEGLCKLTNYEIDFKEANMIRSMVKVGAFPHQKGISDFDFEFQPSVNPEEIKDFATLRFLENAENIVFLGPSGVGKTHLRRSRSETDPRRCYFPQTPGSRPGPAVPSLRCCRSVPAGRILLPETHR